MTFSEWRNQGKPKKQATQTYQTISPNLTDTEGPMTFARWRKRKQNPADPGLQSGDTASSGFSQWRKQRQSRMGTVQNWATSSTGAITAAEELTGSWFDKTDYETYYSRLTALWEEADSWRSQYADQGEILKEIDAIGDALNSARSYVVDSYDYYGKWESREEYEDWYGNYGVDLTNLGEQINSAKEAISVRQAEAKASNDRYQEFLNQQTDMDHYDLLESGTAGAQENRERQQQLLKEVQDAQAAVKAAQKLHDDKLGVFTYRSAHQEEERYYALPLEELEKMIPKAKAIAEAKQAAAVEAEANYAGVVDQQDVDRLEMNTWTPEKEAQRQEKQKLWEESSIELDKALHTYELMSDIYTYRRDMQIIEGMTAEERESLEKLAGGAIRDSNGKIVDMARKVQTAYDSLHAQGYSREQILGLTESYDRMENEKNMRKTQKIAESFGEEHPILSTLSSYPAKLLGSVTGALNATGAYVWNASGLSQYELLDPNLPGYLPSAYAGGVRGAVSDKLGGFDVVYDGVNSAVDTLLRYVVGGGTGASVLAAMDSFGTAVREVSANGGRPDQAVLLGFVNAGAEWLVEKLPVDELLKIDSPKGLSHMLWNIEAQGIAEVWEEEMGFIGSLAAEAAVLAKDSDFLQQVSALMQLGYSREDAKKQVYSQLFREAGRIAASSFLSGAVMEGAHAATRALKGTDIYGHRDPPLQGPPGDRTLSQQGVSQGEGGSSVYDPGGRESGTRVNHTDGKTTPQTGREALAWVLENKELREIDPRTRGVLREYGRHLQQLQKIRDLQSQLQVTGIDASTSQLAQRNFTKLEGLYARHERRLTDLEKNPRLQRLAQQSLTDLTPTEPRSVDSHLNAADMEVLCALGGRSADDLQAIVKRGTIKIQNGFASFPDGDPLNENIRYVIPSEGYFDVGMHGTPSAVCFGTTEANMSARLLANLIRHSEEYHGQKIRLLSCSTGEVTGNDACFAEELANALGVEVVAPNDILYISSNGLFQIGEFGEGEFITYVPNQRRRIK